MKRSLLRLLARLGLLRLAYRAWEELQALRPRERPRVDGPPLPPRRLMVRVAGTADPDWFLRSGRAAYDAIVDHVPLEAIDSVLDFGCGCGRVTRRWRGLDGIHGSDMSRDAVEWCRRNLAFARFETNSLAPPLAFADASFDLVYALSVFTHLTVELQRAWLAELARVLRPNGLLLVTTHGAAYAERLAPEERAGFARGEVVVRWAEVEGTNLCAAYHPPGALERLAPPELTSLDLEPEGALGNPRQDVNLLRRRG